MMNGFATDELVAIPTSLTICAVKRIGARLARSANTTRQATRQLVAAAGM